MFTSALKMFLNSSVVTAVTDAYFNLVTLLLPGNGTNGAQNNTFLDSSSNNFTITRNGNTTQGTFTPFSQTGWGNFFDGTGDYLSNTSTALITNTVSTFTVECWIYLTATPPADVNNISALCTLDGQPTGPTNYLSFGPKNDGKLYLFWFDGAVKSAAGGTALALNTWYHIACVVNSNAIQFYVNGVAETMSGTTTLTNRSGSQGNFAVGSSSAGQITGYISNFRVTTTAVYTSAFTPPTSALTNITNTKLLTCQSNRFVDNSSNAYALTINGTPSVQAFSPFAPTAAYSTTDVGGSGYLDGSDWLTVGAASDWTFMHNGSDWTCEFWVNYTGTAAYTIASTTAFSAQIGFTIAVNSVYGGGLVNGAQLYTVRGDGSSEAIFNSTALLVPGQWNYVAITFTSSTKTCAFTINGASAGSTANTGFSYSSSNPTNTLAIGRFQGSTPGNYLVGYLGSLRISTNVRTGLTTIPTSPYTSDANTKLLTNFTNAGITDATAKNDLETVGNAQISTTQSKFGGSSIYLDGTGDWLSLPMTETIKIPASSAFTVEGWFYLTAAQANYRMILSDNAATPTYISINSTGLEAQFGAVPGTIASITQTFNQNTWYHIAIVRNSSNVVSVYVDGTSKTVTNSTQSGAFLYQGTTLWVGRYGTPTAYEFFGYIDDLRITKGYARYTANFTAPTAAFPLQ